MATLNDTSMKNTNLYNLIGWIIDANARFSNDGFVKLLKNKSVKVMKICDDIISVIPTLKPVLGQMLLSLILIIKPVPVPSLMIYINWDMGYPTRKCVSLRINGQNGAPDNLQLYIEIFIKALQRHTQ